jgi:hypothetical protein
MYRFCSDLAALRSALAEKTCYLESRFCAREPVHGLPDGAGEEYRFFALEMPQDQGVLEISRFSVE